jgi:hypothetical protein
LRNNPSQADFEQPFFARAPNPQVRFFSRSPSVYLDQSRDV